MKKRLNQISLLLGISCLIIMGYIFYNISIFIDEYNFLMSNVLGSLLGIYLYWFMGIAALIICFISIINIKRN